MASLQNGKKRANYRFWWRQMAFAQLQLLMPLNIGILYRLLRIVAIEFK